MPRKNFGVNETAKIKQHVWKQKMIRIVAVDGAPVSMFTIILTIREQIHCVCINILLKQECAKC